MASHGVNRAEENRRIRQEGLREQLSNKGLLQQVLESTTKLANLSEELDALQIQRLRAANETRLKLINKYLPDLKQVDTSITGEDGGPLEIRIVRLTPECK